ncbi:MAG: response regulator transcription factor [Chloroflexi bacterium]|nr:response regulator transcription factor [Chloroflexota bacterium]
MTMKILLADDHTLVRRGIRALLETQPDLLIVGEAATGREAVAKTRALAPDVVLMDIGMPELDGLDATAQIKRDTPNVNVLLLTVHDDANYLFRALAVGASGYILKGAEVAELLLALQAVQRGEVYLQPSAAKHLVGEYLKQASGTEKKQIEELTARQREILTLIAEGLTNQQIADKLVLSPFTIATHRANLMQKLNLHNRSELIRYALRHGLIDAEG